MIYHGAFTPSERPSEGQVFTLPFLGTRERGTRRLATPLGVILTEREHIACGQDVMAPGCRAGAGGHWGDRKSPLLLHHVPVFHASKDTLGNSP